MNIPKKYMNMHSYQKVQKTSISCVSKLDRWPVQMCTFAFELDFSNCPSDTGYILGTFQADQLRVRQMYTSDKDPQTFLRSSKAFKFAHYMTDWHERTPC